MKLGITLILLIGLLYMITKKKWNPFIAMMGVSFVAGIMLGLPLPKIADSFENGVGSILGSLALILGLGAMIAQLMEESGAAKHLALVLLQKLGVKHLQVATLVVGMLIGFALFFDAAFILLIPILLTIAKQMKVNPLYLGIPATAALLTVHTFFPPHPGAVEIIKTLHVNEGMLFVIGLCVAILSILVSGLWWSRHVCGSQSLQQPLSIEMDHQEKTLGAKWSAFLLLLPVLLIALGSFIPAICPISWINHIFKFIGNPVVALLVTLLLVIYQIRYHQGKSTDKISDILGRGVQTIALVLLINGAGGGMKQILMDAGVTKEVTHLLSYLHLPTLWMGFLIAALMRLLLGSSTIAAITASSMIVTLPMPGGIDTILVALAIGAGSMFGSHINDPGFWLFKQYFHLSVIETFKTWTMMTIIGSLTSMIILTILSVLL